MPSLAGGRDRDRDRDSDSDRDRDLTVCCVCACVCATSCLFGWMCPSSPFASLSPSFPLFTSPSRLPPLSIAGVEPQQLTRIQFSRIQTLKYSRTQIAIYLRRDAIRRGVPRRGNLGGQRRLQQLQHRYSWSQAWPGGSCVCECACMSYVRPSCCPCSLLGTRAYLCLPTSPLPPSYPRTAETGNRNSEFQRSFSVYLFTKQHAK